IYPATITQATTSTPLSATARRDGGSPLGDHVGDGDTAVMAQRQVPAPHAQLGGDLRRTARHVQLGPAVLTRADLRLAVRQTRRPPERLGDRLLGGEARRERPRRTTSL